MGILCENVQLLIKYACEDDHNHKLQTNPQHPEEETQNTDWRETATTQVVSVPIWSKSGHWFRKKSYMTRSSIWPQELEVLSLSQLYSLKTKISQCHYVVMTRSETKFQAPLNRRHQEVFGKKWTSNHKNYVNRSCEAWITFSDISPI